MASLFARAQSAAGSDDTWPAAAAQFRSGLARALAE
jgi:hypothetical protein